MTERPVYRRIGVRRGLGGWGDVQMGLAAAELLAAETGERITFGCPPELVPLGDNVPGLEVVPLEEFDTMTFRRMWHITDPCIKYENALQPHVDRNRPDIFAIKMGLKGKPRLKVYLNPQEEAQAHETIQELGFSDKFRLGVIPHSYAKSRDWEPLSQFMFKVTANFPDIQPLVFLAKMHSWEVFEFNLSGHVFYRPGLRRILALLNECHLVLGVDTGPMHSAAGLGVPTIWLFTHIDGRIRTDRYPGAEIIQRTDLPCCPCWYEARCHDASAFMRCKDLPEDEILARIEAHYRRWECSSLNTRTAQENANTKLVTGTASQQTSP